jgi:exopolyphosphatase/guanosine-5'-triphosphate,3'-diphosphate pyrophosphatase
MSEEPFGLLEFGSNSLKFYIVEFGVGDDYHVRTYKRPWGVAHDFFTNGDVSEESVQEIIDAIRDVQASGEGIPLSSMLVVATGVFREVEDMDDLAARIREETSVRMRVISGEEEARLMAKCFPKDRGEGSFLLCDLGGATTEWAWILDGQRKACGSLALGAIRIERKFGYLKARPDDYLDQAAQYCDLELRSLPPLPETTVLSTGGTAKAVSRLLGASSIEREQLDELIDQVAEAGPPETLKPERQVVFLAGLVILDRILECCDSDILECAHASVRDGMAHRLIHLLSSFRRSDLHSTLLLHTRAV